MNQAVVAPGTMLAGKYRVDRVLGRGGSVAHDAELVLRFEREAEAARKIVA